MNQLGDHCEECAVGFYGDATQGSTSDCLACPCYEPRVVNASCSLKPDGSGGVILTCDYCEEGYIGPICSGYEAILSIYFALIFSIEKHLFLFTNINRMNISQLKD